MLQRTQPGSKAHRGWWCRLRKRIIDSDMKHGVRLNKRVLEGRIRKSEDIQSGGSYRKLHKHAMWGYIN